MSSLAAGTSGGAAAGPAAPQRRSGQLPTMGGTMGGGGRYGGGGAYNRGMNPYNQQANQPFQSVAGQPGAAAGPSTFQQRLNQIVSRAAGASELQLLTDARIVPDERSNSLIVFANKEDMKMITNIVAKVDVLLAQVLIEGIVLSVDLKNDQSLGVSWLQKEKRFDQNFTGAGGVNNGQSFFSGLTNLSSSLPSGFSYFGKLGNSFDVALQALANDSRARVLQRPRIQTSHAKPADFFFGSTVPYITGIYNYG